MSNLSNLSKIEKVIVDYIVSTDKINDETVDSISEIDMSQLRSSSVESLLWFIFDNDTILKDTGVEIGFDSKLKQPTIHLLGEIADDDLLIGDWFVFQRASYVFVKIPSFLNQLEKDGFLDKVGIRKEFINVESKLKLRIHDKENYSRTFELKNKNIVNQFIECLGNIYVPTYKLREFQKNEYKTTELLIQEKDIELSKQNNKIAKIALYTAVFSAIASLIATIITLYSIGIPATIKIDEKQVNTIIKSVESGNKRLLKNDTIRIMK